MRTSLRLGIALSAIVAAVAGCGRAGPGGTLGWRHDKKVYTLDLSGGGGYPCDPSTGGYQDGSRWQCTSTAPVDREARDQLQESFALPERHTKGLGGNERSWAIYGGGRLGVVASSEDPDDPVMSAGRLPFVLELHLDGAVYLLGDRLGLGAYTSWIGDQHNPARGGINAGGQVAVALDQRWSLSTRVGAEITADRVRRYGVAVGYRKWHTTRADVVFQLGLERAVLGGGGEALATTTVFLEIDAAFAENAPL